MEVQLIEEIVMYQIIPYMLSASLVLAGSAVLAANKLSHSTVTSLPVIPIILKEKLINSPNTTCYTKKGPADSCSFSENSDLPISVYSDMGGGLYRYLTFPDCGATGNCFYYCIPASHSCTTEHGCEWVQISQSPKDKSSYTVVVDCVN